MTNKKNLVNYSQYVLTWLFVLFLKRTTINGTETVALGDETVTVFNFRAERPEFAQATPFGTIIWNQNQTEGLSKIARRLVLSHERSHRDRNPIWKGLLYGGIINVAVVCVVVPKLTLEVVSGGLPFEMLYPLIGVGLLFVIGFLLALRIEETLADYQALQQLGEDRFTEAYEELSESGSSSMVSDTFRTLLYTNPKQTIKLHRIIEQYNWSR